MTEEQFNKWWKDNRHRLLHEDKEYAERENSYKIKSGADLLLFAIPALAGIIFLESGLVKHEMLNWLCAAIVVIVTFLISAFIKSMRGSDPNAAVYWLARMVEGGEDPAFIEMVKKSYCLWRFMIDKRYQGKGYGKKAMQLALDYIRTFPCGKADTCWLSYEPENEVAKKLYASFGFIEQPQFYKGEEGEEIPAILKL
jgi:ribosomal protein S18 acetylase RimI-like enzyme